MEQFLPDHWSFLFLGLILSITLVQLLAGYVLSSANPPPAGLGMFSVYAVATLLGWILFSLQQGTNAVLDISVPSVAWIINGYLLYLAAAQRSEVNRGRMLLGALSLGGCFGVLLLDEARLLTLSASLSSLNFVAAGVIFLHRATSERNIGDAIAGIAAALMVSAAVSGLYQQQANGSPDSAQITTFSIYSWAYALVIFGFLTSVLVEYQGHLSHLATTDPLTRLLNRRGMEASLQVTFARAQRDNAFTSAIFIDIDRFKQINDSFGYDTGDKLIRMVAGIIARNCRGSDVLARVDGEEFLLVMPDTRLDHARRIAERLRESIADHPLWVEHHRIPLTVSLGVACGRGELSLEQLEQKANHAMNLARHNGRNRVAWVDSAPVRLSST